MKHGNKHTRTPTHQHW